MKKFLSIIFFFFSFVSFTQNQKVELENFDYQLYSELVLKEVNALRRKKKVKLLEFDSTLFKAAQDHSDYMSVNNYVGHNQKSNIKKTPENRVEFYDGTHQYIGENVQMIDIEFSYYQSKGKLTYQQLAKETVENWKKSPDHYNNIVHENYFGLVHGITIKNGKLFICQVFGSKPFVEAYDYRKGEEIYVKNAKPCHNCKSTIKSVNKGEGIVGWYSVSNDSVYYWNEKYYYKNHFYRKKKGYLISVKKENINLVFGGKGKISMDLIHHEQFDCDGNKMYHKALNYDGYYLGSLSKFDLKYNDVSPYPDLYKVYVGQTPAFQDTFYQVDLNLVKKNKPCFNNNIVYINADFFKPHEYFKISKPVLKDKDVLIIEDSVLLKISFERNQTNEDTSIFRPLIIALDSLTKDSHNIEAIYYTGVASIEGNKESNEKLIQKRGNTIENHLKKYYPEINFVNKYYENFDDFRSGLAILGYKKESELEDEELREWTNKNLQNKAIEQLLNSTRESEISIRYKDEILIENEGFVMSIQSIQKFIDDKKVKEANTVFKYIAHQIFEGDSSQLSDLLTIKIPEDKLFADLHWSFFVYELNVLPKKTVTQEKLQFLYDVGAIPSNIELIEYKLMFNIFYGNNSINTDDFWSVIGEVKQKRKKAWLETLELISGVQNLRYDPQMVSGIITNAVLKNNFDIDQTYFVSQHLINWGYTYEPYILMSKFARQKNAFPKLYKQYIVLAFYLKKFEEKKDWKNIYQAMKNLSSLYPLEFCSLFKWDQMGVRALEKKEVIDLFCEVCKTEG